MDQLSSTVSPTSSKRTRREYTPEFRAAVSAMPVVLGRSCYSPNLTATGDAMTPGINLAKKSKITHKVHSYEHDPGAASYGLEAAEKLSINPRQVFKTLVVKLDGDTLAVGVVPVVEKLNMKLIAKAAGAKKAAMAEPSEVERTTGYVLGGVSPLGQKKRLKTFVDSSAKNLTTIFVSAGRRGLEIELSPLDLLNLVNGNFADLCQP